MVSAINNALSGLAAASQRIEVAADNIANQSSTTSKVNGVDSSTPFLPQDVVQISEAGGGVRTQQRTVPNPTQTLYNPNDPNADKNGNVQAPNVDIAQQLVNTKIAGYDFKANLKVIQAQQNTDKSLLDIFS